MRVLMQNVDQDRYGEDTAAGPERPHDNADQEASYEGHSHAMIPPIPNCQRVGALSLGDGTRWRRFRPGKREPPVD